MTSILSWTVAVPFWALILSLLGGFLIHALLQRSAVWRRVGSMWRGSARRRLGPEGAVVIPFPGGLSRPAYNAGAVRSSRARGRKGLEA